MICQFCGKRIRKGKKASGNRIKISRVYGKPGLFIHAKCLDPWRVRERIRGSRTAVIGVDIGGIGVSHIAILKGRQHGMATYQAMEVINDHE